MVTSVRSTQIARRNTTAWRGRRPWDEKERGTKAVRADRGGVFFHNGEKVVCLEGKKGEDLWRSEPIERRVSMPVNFGPRLIVYRGVVLFTAGTGWMSAHSIEAGRTLWTADHPRSGHFDLEDLLIADRLVWSGASTGGGFKSPFADLPTRRFVCEWTKDIPLHVRARVLMDKTPLVAGPPELLDEEKPIKRINDPAIQA